MDRMITRNAEQEQRVKVYAPDMSLQKKIGGDLDRILTPQIVAAAQAVIAQSSDQFLEEGLLCLDDLVRIDGEIQASPETALQSVPFIIEDAFMLKVQVGQAGYELVAALAKSLQLHSEKIKDKLASKDLQLIHWHVITIQQLLRSRIKGDGGQVGQVILDELKQLHAASLS